LEQGRGTAWHVWINARHGRGTAWARHAMCESAFRVPGGWGSPEFLDNRHMKVLSLSALRTCHLYPQETSLVLISFKGWVDPRVIVRPEGNGTGDLPACSAVPQPSAPTAYPDASNKLHDLFMDVAALYHFTM